MNIFRNPIQSAVAVVALIAISIGGLWLMSVVKHRSQNNNQVIANTNTIAINTNTGINANTVSNTNTVSQNTNSAAPTNTSTPPAEAITACSGKASGANCEFNDKGTVTQGTCDDKPGVLACNPTNINRNTNQALATNSNSSTVVTNDNGSYASYSTCLEHTKTLAASKDCCDCLNVDASVRKACRDAAATYDFTKNTTFQEFTIPSTVGRNGDYSACTTGLTQTECKQCCDTSSQYACGDYQYCRTACDALK